MLIGDLLTEMMHYPLNRGETCNSEENSKMVFDLKQSSNNDKEIVIKYSEVFDNMTENQLAAA